MVGELIMRTSFQVGDCPSFEVLDVSTYDCEKLVAVVKLSINKSPRILLCINQKYVFCLTLTLVSPKFSIYRAVATIA